MGDRTWVHVYVRHKDLEALCKHFDEDPSDWDGDLISADIVGDDDTPTVRPPVCIEGQEINGGWYDELTAAAEAGLVFYGASGAGSEYGSIEFAATMGTLFEEATDHNSSLTIRARDFDGLPDEQALAEVRNYVLHRKLVVRIVDDEPCEHCKKWECDIAFEACSAAKATADSKEKEEVTA